LINEYYDKLNSSRQYLNK